MRLYRGTFETDRLAITYHRTGGDLPPVVLIHGLTDSGLVWSNVIASLAFSYDVVVPDMRGHGYTGLAADDDYSVPAMAADVVALVEGLELDRPIIVGHSMGGSIATYLGAEYGHLLRGLVLIDPPWYDLKLVTPESIADARREYTENLEMYKSMNYAELDAFIRNRNPLWDDDERRSWIKAKQTATIESLDVAPWLARDWPTLTGKIRLPGLLLTGEPSLGAIITPEIARQVLSEHENWTEYHSPKAGHSVHRDDRDGSIRAIKRFLLNCVVDSLSGG